MKDYVTLGCLISVKLLITVLLFIGWVQCVYKSVNCNWEPIGKAEVIYTAGVFTGLGGIIGWFDIEDK